jgi:membrane protein DedA with SNARE-associated domain
VSLPTYVLFYLGLGALLTAEEAGVFLLPGDSSRVAAGVYAAQGGPLVYVSWLVASLGMVAGSAALFFTVRRSRASARVLPDRVRDLIQKHGALGVGVARLVPGFRNMTVFAAAAASLAPQRFMLGLVPAALLWSGFLMLVGWFGGNAILSLLGALDGQPAIKVVSIALVLCGALFWALRMRLTARESPQLP